jgi:regulator of replication initiation timing
MGAIEDMRQIVFRVTDERDAARNEVERLKQALHDARLENSGQAMLLERKRPEPSRLEIAAMLLADGFYVVETALAEADALIAAAKEGK